MIHLLWIMAAYATAQGGRVTPEPTPNDPLLPEVIVHAERQYLIGFPLLVAVTFQNPSGGDHFFDLPELDLFFGHGPIGLRLAPDTGGKPIGFPPSYPMEGIAGMKMGPGESRLMLLDLSNFGLAIPPGRYYLTLTLKVTRYTRSSTPVAVEFLEPNATDVIEATYLRRMGDAPTDTGAWAPFIFKNWNTVTPPNGLSLPAARQLALHLFMHRALFGPTPVAQLNVASLRQSAPPVVQGEVAALDWEIQMAAHSTTFAPDLGAWPGVRFRYEMIKRGEGFLTRFRKAVGAEREFLHPPPFMPYQ
jgi:hypothetical protein